MCQYWPIGLFKVDDIIISISIVYLKIFKTIEILADTFCNSFFLQTLNSFRSCVGKMWMVQMPKTLNSNTPLSNFYLNVKPVP